MLSTIEHFRDRIFAISGQAENRRVDPTPAGLAELAERRLEMAAALSGYAKFVHCAIYAPLATAGTFAEATAAKALKVESICLVEEFRAFTSRWQFADLASAWLEYQPEASDFRQRIRCHLDRVTSLSDPALAHIQLERSAEGA